MSFLSAYASLLGQMAAADGVVVEDEEVEAAEVFEAVVFSDKGLLPPPVLQALDLTKAEMKSELMRQFGDPLPVKRIVEFAKENGLEESFYQDACLMARADKTAADDERDFLSEFAEMLNVNRIDRIRIERRYLAEGTDWLSC